MDLKIVLAAEGDGQFSATASDLPAVFATGDTADLAVANFNEGARLYFDWLREHGAEDRHH